MAALSSYQPQQLLYPSPPKHWLQWSPRFKFYLFKACSISEFQLPFLRRWCWENSGQPMLAMWFYIWFQSHCRPCWATGCTRFKGVFVKADFEALDVSLPWGILLRGESRI